MASLQDQVGTVKAAVASIASCTPATVVLLKELLVTREADVASNPSQDTKKTKTARTTTSKQNGSTSRTAGAKKGAAGAAVGDEDKPELPAREKALLATHIINATLKSLGDAAKAPPAAAPKKPAAGEEDSVGAETTRRRIRRSNSAPMTPMQPRCLNRMSTSPEMARKAAPTPKIATVPGASTGCLSTVECARVAFSALRSLQSSAKITLPELQLEAGMSSLVGKLISLGLTEHASKELRVLKRRLVELLGTERKTAAKTTPNTLSLAEILDFQGIKASGQTLTLVIATQIQALRILTTQKRPKDIQAALPFLRRTNNSSPTSFLLSSAAANTAEKTKAARQLETVSQLLLSLAPSISSSDDETAAEPRLSVQPTQALELQTTALETRLCWWKLAGHNANVDKDMLSPLSKCIATYVRRTKEPHATNYRTCLASFNVINDQMLAQALKPAESCSKSPLACIYGMLGRLARIAGFHDEAVSWMEKASETLDRNRDSAAKCFSTSALLLAHRLRVAWKYPSQDALLKEVLEGLHGSLRGDSSELDELLDSLVMVRKSATYVVFGSVTDEDGRTFQASRETTELLETFIMQMPRFCLRWLGKRPSAHGNTKDFLRYEQRRTVMAASAAQVLDSALMVAKAGIDKKHLVWDKLDTPLQDCLTFLDNLGDLSSIDPTCHYYAKISHLYYMQYGIFIAIEPRPTKTGTNFAYALKALRRSIYCVKDRSRNERKKAQVRHKLERITALYSEAGKMKHALEFLQIMRSNFVEDGVLSSVAQALKNMPPRKAWASTQEIQSLAWTIKMILKAEKIWTDWTTTLDEPERLAALEFGLECAISNNGTGIDPLDPSVTALLDICSVDKFPMRRLGILLRLLVVNIGNEAHLQTIRDQVEEVVAINEDADLSEDANLKGCFSHMKALSTSMIALACPSPDFEKLEQSMSVWRTILDSSKEPADLANRIDDVPALLEHLQSVADYARLSNRDGLLLEALQLAAGLVEKSKEVDSALRLQVSAALALQLTNMGQSEKAATLLQQVQHAESDSHEETVCFLMSYAEYFIEVGNVDKADELLHQAKEASSGIVLSARSRAHKIMMAQASLLYSSVALGRGDAPCALTHARNATRLLFQEWLRLEQQTTMGSPETIAASMDVSEVQLDASLVEATDKSKALLPPKISGPEAWKLAHPVLRGLLFLSNTYAHLGMYQETVFYAGQAQRIAQATDSAAYLAECDAWRSTISARAGKFDDALKSVGDIKSRLDEGDYSSKLVGLYCQLGSVYREARDFGSEEAMLEMAEAMLKRMAGEEEMNEAAAKLPAAPAAAKRSTTLTIREKPVVPARRPRTTATRIPTTKAPTTRTRVTKVSATKTPTARAAPKKLMTARPAPLVVVTRAEVGDPYLRSLEASVLVAKASSMLHQKDWTGAWQLLQEVRQSSKLASDMLSELVATAQSLLGQSMDQMAKDAVYSVIQESTLSFPSINFASNIDRADRFSMIKASPPRKMADPLAAPTIKSTTQGYLDNLREARESLLEAHAMASVQGDGRAVHKILCMLQTVVILLSAASSSSRKAGILGHPGYATCSVEMARNLTWNREHKALLSEKSSGRHGLEWPEEIRSAETRRTSLSPTVDMTKFQREYIDIIPEEWSVISVSLSDNKHDLCISKLQAGQSPFVIRLPLERATSRDADNEVFNFQEGQAKMREFIKQANTTCHDKDFSVKGAGTAWWAARSALDTQLKELLKKIESIWLGGFKGIFSQHQKHPQLLAKFQNDFQTMLDKYLPSRRQVRGKKTTKPAASKIALDIRVLELFIGLGDASDEECDFDEMLNDLLYFVVDILQFHGERNAYDEIDFDAMVVETLDALHSYHANARDLEPTTTRSHTILVLDKVLHTFPWESMPCLRGLSVSRVPSMACLRRLILEQQPSRVTTENEEPKKQGHHVSPDNGTCILNPSGDLKNTVKLFEGPLTSSLSDSWKRIHNKPPTESEFEDTLASNDILLYMGHGGGHQYIRSRQIRRLKKCRATALLMGCSSASLADVGDFELYGNIWNYMLAGCPAVVGTLWDVTDKDIDLYTATVYEEWGLVRRGAFQASLKKDAKAVGKAVSTADDSTAAGATKHKKERSTSRKRAPPGSVDGGDDSDTAYEYGDASLPEAVARAREADVCKFKYLNAGAVCVYGIPVYVDRSSSERRGRE